MITRLMTLCVLGASLLQPQGRPVDWPSYGGDARRTGWERSDTRITKDNVKDFKLVLKRKFEGLQTGVRTLTPPVIIGLLISYKGFKELGFVADNSGGLWSIDVDLNRVFWKKKLPVPTTKGSAPICSEGLVATPALTPPVTFGGRRPGGRTPVTPPGTPVSPGIAPTPAGTTATLPARLGGTGFGAPRPVYVLAGDGSLHQLNSSDGSDQYPALKFLPPNARASTLTMNEHVIYTTTSGKCGGVPDSVWAIDLATEEPTVASFPLEGQAPSPLGGFAIGNDGTVYVPAAKSLLALSSKSLKPKHRFSLGKASPTTTPVVFEYNGRDLIVTAGDDGSLYMLDSEASDDATPLYRTPSLAPGASVTGGISSWEDADGVRWIAAPVKGPVNSATPNGAIAAFKVEEQNGKTVLTQGWVSRDMKLPQPPVITSGVVFAVAAGGTAPAILHAFDGTSGQELYSTGSQVTAPANLTGVTLANGRVFFTTTDGTLYAFGVYMEI